MKGKDLGDSVAALSHNTDTAADFKLSNTFFLYSSVKYMGLISPNQADQSVAPEPQYISSFFLDQYANFSQSLSFICKNTRLMI